MQYLTPLAAVGRYTLPPFRLRGIGLAGPTDLQMGQQAAGIAAAGAGAALASAAAVTTAGAIIPFVGPAIAAAGLILEAIMNSGCGQTCILSSNFANQAEAALKQNLDAYMAEPIPRSASANAKALGQYDAFWGWLKSQCSNPQLGNAGVRCITDRQSGACHFHDANGQCWNWDLGYREPIANDPHVVSDAEFAAMHQAAGSTVVPGGIAAPSSPNLFLWGGVGLLLFGLMSGGQN